MANKRKKAQVPKRLAGVKIPKPVRRALRELAASQSGRAAISEALVAAGAMLSVVRSKSDVTIGEPAPAAKTARPPATDDVETRVAFEEATRSFTDTLRKRSLGEAGARMMAEEPLGSTH